MANSVKFYSMSALPETSKIDPNGLYFVNGGELYKGATRFGCGKVTQLESAPSEGMARGDVNISNGKTEIYDGTSWVTVTADVSVVQSQWQADIKSWVSGLAVGDSNSYITNITQDANGKVVATAVSFPSFVTGDADGQVKLGSINASVSGWDTLTASVSDLESRVSDLEYWQSSISGDEIVEGTQVTAESGKFTNLTVTDTATFSATNISADSLTIGGSTVEQLADKQIASIATASASGSSNGVEVVVTTQSGSVKEVDVTVDVTASAADIKTDAANTKIARAKDVADAISGLTGAMHFRGVFASKTSVENPQNGDVIVIGSGDDSGKEFVYCKTSDMGEWIELGNETMVGNLATYTGYNTALTTSATTLAGGINELDAKIKAMDADVTSTEDNGVKVEVVQTSGAITSVVTTVDAIESAAGVVTSETKVVTAGAVADKIDAVIGDLDSSVSCSESGVNVTITQADGKLTGVTAELVWLTA